MAIINYFAISGRDMIPVYNTGGTNTDSTKWYTVTGTIATSAHQTSVPYASAKGIGSLGVKSAIAGVTLPTIREAMYDVYAYMKSWISIGGYVRVNGGEWSAGASTASETVFAWVKLGTLPLKTGDLLEITNNSGGGSCVVIDLCIVPTGKTPRHIPIGTEGSRMIAGNFSTIVSSINLMTVGDRIPFHYKAASNAFGVIDQLGSSNVLEIPISSSITPDGTAYFIMVGYDHKGRKKLVADRNIQHSISWDTLNTAGVASGSGLPVAIDGISNYTIRLLTGGTSTADTDNEWDKIIAGSTLNGAIVAGDNATWNWTSLYTWTSTTVTSAAANRVLRGNASVSTFTHAASGYVGYGFRPVLIIEDTANVTIEKATPTHLYVGQHSTFTIEANVIFIGNPVDFKIQINGTDFDVFGSATSRTIPINNFIVGTNAVRLITADGGTISVNVVLEAPYRLTAERTFKSYDGGYETSNTVFGTTNTAKVRPTYTPSIINNGNVGTNKLYVISFDKFTNNVVVN